MNGKCALNPDEMIIMTKMTISNKKKENKMNQGNAEKGKLTAIA